MLLDSFKALASICEDRHLPPGCLARLYEEDMAGELHYARRR